MTSVSYADFLASKVVTAPDAGLAVEAIELGDHLFDYQDHCVRFALRKGRAALFLDTGLGKTLCQLEFCRHAGEATGQPSLILTPLAVARQIEAEAQRFGYDARVVRDQNDVRSGINICNYDRLHKIEPSAFGAVALDESSILKSFTGKTSRYLRDVFSDTPFRLCATATPAPNDPMELGQHAEFLGVMDSGEMLSRWFIADQTRMGRYRLKSHGITDFWAWVSSWARMAVAPSDLGFDDSRHVLPPLEQFDHFVEVDLTRSGELFAAAVSSTSMHDCKRESAATRANKALEIVQNEPDEQWVVWCDSNYESEAVWDAFTGVVTGVRELRGGGSPTSKERTLEQFRTGDCRVLITKPSLAGFGLNWQHCARMCFVGRSFSYELYYQAVRRCWRFGQKRTVHAHIICDQTEMQIASVVERKQADHATMKAAMAAAMRNQREQSSQLKIAYNACHEGSLPSWLSAA